MTHHVLHVMAFFLPCSRRPPPLGPVRGKSEEEAGEAMSSVSDILLFRPYEHSENTRILTLPLQYSSSMCSVHLIFCTFVSI